MDSLSFVETISPIFGALNDLHVSVRPSDAFTDGLAFPIACALSGNKTIVLASVGGAVVPGSKLVSLEGVPAERIRDVTLAGWGGQTARARAAVFGMVYSYVAGIVTRDPLRYEVRSVAPGGVEHVVTLPREKVSLPSGGIDGPLWPSSAEPYEYRTLAGGVGRVGLIDYRRCEDCPRFDKFLERTFRQVKDEHVRAVVVDIRNNPGGEGSLNDALLRYLTDKPFTQIGSFVTRSSRHLKEGLGKA
jgi:Peptidase family S41